MNLRKDRQALHLHSRQVGFNGAAGMNLRKAGALAPDETAILLQWGRRNEPAEGFGRRALQRLFQFASMGPQE